MSHLSEEELILHYYGETGNPAPVERHLDTCPACRAAYSSLERVLNVMDALPIPERSQGYEAAVWRRVSGKLPTPSRLRLWPWRWATAGAVLAAALMTLIVWHPTAPLGKRRSKPPASASGTDPFLQEQILRLAVGDYLDRSGIVLTELANASSDAALDISTEQERTADLLAECRLYRQTALRADDNIVAGVLDELERVLLEVAHAPSRLDPAQVDELRRHLRSEGVLFRIRVLSSTVRSQGEHRL
jgi:hypothetical protein